MLDPTLALASAVHSSKGAYALLIGSGVSSAAGIPTGYAVLLDLIRRVSVLKGGGCGPDPEAWYRQAFGEDPTYPALLGSLGATPAERSQLLRAYFEPTQDEREQGLKAPTMAHHAIAELMERGFVRIVVTTNFDRLLEQAIGERGITPVVISSPDQISGMLPLPHVQHLVVKVHGDYLDTRMSNTSAELATFAPATKQLLTRILESFGLIVCGWSGEHDTAFCKVLEESGTGPFGTCWTTRGPLSRVTAQLVAHRKAQVVPITDANSFFGELREKVMALQDRAGGAPVSIQVLVTRLKKYLPDEKRYIELHDLLQGETDRLLGILTSDQEMTTTQPPTPENIAAQMQEYERAVACMGHLLATGSYYGQPRHIDEWIAVIKRVARRPVAFTPYPDWDAVRRYPAVLLCYVVGIGAIASGREDTFASAMTSRIFEEDGKERPAFHRVHPWSMDGMRLGAFPDLAKKREGARFSIHVHRVLRDLFRELLPDEMAFNTAFDRFELLACLIVWDVRAKAPLGRFAWLQDPEDETTITHRMEREIEEQRQNWLLVKHGFFGGDFVKAKAALMEIRRLIEKSRY